MRARPLLLLLAAAAASALAAAPALLVLRSACRLRDPAAFSERRLRAYAGDAGRPAALPRPLRILGYDETCGKNWRTAIAQNALATLSGGGSVMCTGRPGAGVCGALAAASRVLRRPQPTACAAPDARGAAVAQLAKRLNWRRVLLPSQDIALGAECSAALRKIESSLAHVGVTVLRTIVSYDETTSYPHASLFCVSDYSSSVSEYIGLGALLFLHIDEVEPSETTSPHNTNNNNGFPAMSLPHVKKEMTPYIPLSTVPGTVSSTSNSKLFEKSFTSPSSVAAPKYENEIQSLPTATWTAKFISVSQVVTSTRKPINVLQSEMDEIDKTSSRLNLKSQNLVRKRRKTEKRSIGSIGLLFKKLDKSFYNRTLLLSNDFEETTSKSFDFNDVYREAIEIGQRYAYTEHTGMETFRTAYFLYEYSSKIETHSWKRVATFSTTLTRNINSLEDWNTIVDVINTTDGLERWEVVEGAERELENAGAASAAVGAVGALCACGVLALLAGGAAAARAASRRRRLRRRPRAAVLLAPADFTFPADEGRRVGEGMETMLSWLQQLHEFAGPEPERPDLLKRPPPPRAPSAPSSTCSVTRLAPDTRIRYKGDPVHVKQLPAAVLELRRKATDLLLVMQSLRHENLNPFIGCLPEARPALVFAACGRGSLEDVLVADDIRLDWTFRLSLLTDLVRGMRYLHASPLRLHGRLTSRNCVVDSRWVLRVTDYGVAAFTRAQNLPRPPRAARELLWTAPELLREAHGECGGSQPGDVFSFAIIMQEVIVRGEPYCMLALTPEEIVEKLSRPPPLIRPSVSMGAAPPDAVSVMRQCWSEAPDLRPDFNRLYDIFRHLHRGRKINIVDSMFEMLEKYSNNLEELIKERTEQLDMEKKKTEQLLNRMLPRSVAERLMLGMRVEPEEFEEVSIYFSDIVGFTAIAARSTPVQVVDLLNDLYTTFDAAIEQYRVYKVETIGDAYMVVGGLPIRARDHAESIATMALHLLHLAGRFRVRHLPATPLHLRIGLHTGACCAAVVGLTMPRYCLFGDTVNTASRMESTGAAWRIQVSATTAERLTAAGGYRLRSRGLTQVKGKGAMHTYWLLGKDGFDKPLPTPPPLESEEVLFETDGENESEASTPPAVAAKSASVERQRSDPSPTSDKFAWQRSGAVSADSSPPPRAPPARYRYLRSSVSTLVAFGDTSAPSEGYLASGPRALRRQWSLERGDALAAAAAEAPPPPAPRDAREPLALRATPARAPPPRYRTRRDAADDARPP
ncbi:uncharacterized protein [Epargyreus clarus]|uniref:uncharacterized protein n=1 Tax=Epargyreus clarus TaxID=520877 RepID=UPI003C2E4DC3